MSAGEFPIEASTAGRGGRDSAAPLSGKTAWARNLEAPLRDFLRTQSGSAAILLAGADRRAGVGQRRRTRPTSASGTRSLSIQIGGAGISQDLRHWVNSGLMTIFFFVVGLEARREFDLGELRDRRRLTLPVLAGLGGMIVPVAIYLAFNGSDASRGGWGAAMSTDTAFALGMLAIVGRRFPDSLRAFILTVAVVDDFVALIVIAVAFTSSVDAVALAVALAAFAVMLLGRLGRVHNGLVYALLGATAWVAMQRSGIDPVVVGLVMGLLTIAYPASRSDLEEATDLFRVFREQPTPELAQSARAGLRSAISPNERYQQLFHPISAT